MQGKQKGNQLMWLPFCYRFRFLVCLAVAFGGGGVTGFVSGAHNAGWTIGIGILAAYVGDPPLLNLSFDLSDKAFLGQVF